MTTTMSASSLSASGIISGLFTFAISTLTPFCNMGVITMKMINNTSITSTMGVTLMSELTLAPSLRTDIAMEISSPGRLPRRTRACTRRCSPGGLSLAADAQPTARSATQVQAARANPELGPANCRSAAFQEVINQFARRVIHLYVERFHATGQVVEHHHSRDGHQETNSGRD